MNNTTYRLPAILIAAPLLLAACGGIESPSSQATAPADGLENVLTLQPGQLDMLRLSFAKASVRDMRKTMRFNGKVDILPEYLTSVSHPLGGHVTAIHVVPGQVFKQGQVLAVLEDYAYVQLQEDYLMAKAKLKTAERNYNRQQELNVSKASSDRVYEAAEEEYDRLRISVRSLAEKLKLAQLDPAGVSENSISRSAAIRAPFNGMVSHIKVNKGQYANPSDVLFELVNTDGLIVHIKVFEKDLPSIQNDQELTVYTNSHPDKPLLAKVMTINHYIQEDGSADVYAKFTESPYRLALGMFLNAVVTTANHQTWVIPESSVLSYEDKDYVFEQLDANRFRLLPVAVVATHQGFAQPAHPEALQGLTIVDQGSYDLLMAMKNTGDAD